MSTAELVLAAIVLVVAAIASTVDVRRRLIPNRLTGAGAVAAVVAGGMLDPGGEVGRLGCGLGVGGFLLAAAVANPAGMGMGDVKLTGVIGLCLGPAAFVALSVALAAGALYGVAVAARRGLRAARAATLPFGPCLALGALAGVVTVAA